MPAVIMGAMAVCTAAVLLWWTVAGDRRVTQLAAKNLQLGLNVDARSLDMRARMLAAPASERVVLPLVVRVSARTRRLMPGQASRLNQRILMAGMSAKWPLDRTLAAKMLATIVSVPVSLMAFSTGNTMAVAYGLVLPALAYFGPDYLLHLKAKQRQRQIRLLLPDTLDQITVCVEAGLGFEAAMARAAITGTGPLAEELSRTLQDVQLGVPRADALRRMGERNSVDELRRFVQAILQAEAHGVPIARVLRIQSTELRDKRRQAAEEKAMKVSIKMLFPLVFCILPTIFIVILGPAVFRLMDALGGGSG